MKFIRKDFFTKIMVILATAIVFHSELTAQSKLATGKIIVLVYDELGGRIIGAEVVLKNSEKKTLSLLTNSQGIAEFKNLADFEYNISVYKKEFQPYKNVTVSIKNGQTIALDIRLEIAGIESSVNVDENDPSSSDPERFGGTRNLSQKEIDNLPDNPEEMELRLRQIASLSVTGEKTPITVNGFPQTQLPPKGAIKQVRINQNVFSSQFEGVSGGGIEIFTKSGLDKFSGSVGGDLIDSHFNARNPFLDFRPRLQFKTYSGYLQGPLIPKRASFFINFSQRNYNANSAVNAIILSGLLQPTEFKLSIPTSGRNIRSAPTLDFDINEKHQLHLGFEFEDTLNRNEGVYSFKLPSMAYNRRNRTSTFQVSETATVNKAIVNQFRFQFISNNLKQASQNNNVITEVQDAFSDGGAQINSLTNTHRFEMSNDITWQLDCYNLTFGSSLRGVSIKDTSFSNFGGRYVFSGGLAPVLDPNNKSVFDAAGNQVTTFISSLERYRRTLFFRELGYNNAQIRAIGGGASQFFIEGGEPMAKINQLDYSFYIQNSLSIRKDMSLSFGMRYENQTNIKSPFNFAPRLGIVWAPSINQKKKTPLTTLPRISAGIGFFYQRVSEQFVFNEKRYKDRFQYFVDDQNILDLYPYNPLVNQLEQFASPRTILTLDPKVQSPQQILASITIEKTLPFKMNAGLILGFYKVNHALRSRNINAPLAGTYNINDLSRTIYPLGRDSGDIYQTESSGIVKAKVVTSFLKIQKFKFTEFSINYSYRDSKDNLVSGSGSFDPYNFSGEFAVSDNNIKNNFFIINRSRLPFGIGFDNILSIGSGLPFNIILGRDSNGDKLFLERPAFATDLNKIGLISTPYGLLDPNPSPADQIIPRNLGRGSTFAGLDTILKKTFRFSKDSSGNSKYSLNISIFANNILNLNNKAAPIGNLASPNFLRAVSYSTNSVGFFGSTGPRKFRFSINLGF